MADQPAPPHEPHKDELPTAEEIRIAELDAIASSSATRVERDTHVHRALRGGVANIIDGEGMAIMVLLEANGIVPPGCKLGRKLTVAEAERFIEGLRAAIDAQRKAGLE